MITFLTTWITERIVTVLTITLVTVAAVPTTLLVVTEQQVTTVTEEQEIATVRQAGDKIIVKLQDEEKTCRAQVTQVVTTTGATGAQVTQVVANAGTQIHASIAPFVLAIEKDEDAVTELEVITPDDEDAALNQIQIIETTALGNSQTVGVVITTCQTVVVKVKQIIREIETGESGEGDDD